MSVLTMNPPVHRRASDDLEKSTATYLEESQPTQGKQDSPGRTVEVGAVPSLSSRSPCLRLEITIRVDESECLSMASSHDQETERFLCTGTTGRRVSFNEAALLDHGKKTQEKGRRSVQPRTGVTSTFPFQSRLRFLAAWLLCKPRYTLTEGDFHHLKNARLTHLHISPPALNIVTIHECESVENSITATTHPVAKPALSIFQVAAFNPLLLLTCHQS